MEDKNHGRVSICIFLIELTEAKRKTLNLQ
jgi:hypothetical protein